jgi:hypothetical protein
MKIGTKSMLMGVHAFWIHPWFVLAAWRRIYRTTPTWSEVVAIFFHDSYWGLADIDGDEGKQHPRLGAKLARMFGGRRAQELALFHSRSFSFGADRNPSPLSAPDKFSFLLEPEWFYKFRATLSGELREFQNNAVEREGLKESESWYMHYKRKTEAEFQNVIYLPLGNGEFAKVDSDAPPEILSRKWSANAKTPGRTYAYRSSSLDGEKTHVSLHREVLKAREGCEVDHINGDTLDNRRANLRLCPHSQNGCNLRKWVSPTSSRHKGVCLRPNGRWQAYVSFGGRQKYLGLFEVEDDAARAYDREARTLFGDFAKLNFPQ